MTSKSTMLFDNIYTVVEKVLKILVLLSCLGATLWQCWRCFAKFSSEPQGTHMSMIKATGNPLFPSISICPYPFTNTTFNSTILSECDISQTQYSTQARWSNNNIGKCANPKTLYYNIIWKLEDLIWKIRIRPNDLSYLKVLPNETDSYRYIDMRNYGRCYIFIPSTEILKNGIFKMILEVKTKVRVFVTSAGVLGVKLSAEKNT